MKKILSARRATSSMAVQYAHHNTPMLFDAAYCIDEVKHAWLEAGSPAGIFYIEVRFEEKIDVDSEDKPM